MFGVFRLHWWMPMGTVFGAISATLPPARRIHLGAPIYLALAEWTAIALRINSGKWRGMAQRSFPASVNLALALLEKSAASHWMPLGPEPCLVSRLTSPLLE